MPTEWIRTDDIKVSGTKKINAKKVEKHRRAFEHGRYVMPISVHDTGMGFYVVAGNGRHRLAGCVAAGVGVIECEVLNG